MIKKILFDCFTERDNQTFDIVRILGCIAFFVYLILAIMEMKINCKDFQLKDMASGIAIILAVVATGVTLKNMSERS